MKKILYFALIGLLIVGCGSKETYEQQIKQYNLLVDEAKSFNENQQFDKALMASSNAIKITDTLSPALLQIGLANLGLKKWDDAKDNFSDAIDIDGEKSGAYKGRAIANYFLGKKGDFIDDINIFIKHHTGDKYSHDLRGDYYTEKEEYEKAVGDFSVCIKIDPKNEEYYLKRGNAYAMLEKNDASIADYDRYTKLRPGLNNDEVFYKRANLNMKVNKFQKAIDDLQLISNYNRKPKVVLLIADNYSSLQHFDQAIINYSSYLNLRSKDFEAYKKRGTAYLATNNIDLSNHDFQKAALLQWDFQGVLYKYGWWILFAAVYLLIAFLLFDSVKEEYDDKKVSKSYKYFVLSGIFGGHHAYTNSRLKFSFLAIAILAFAFINSFNVRSYYNHKELLWSGILENPSSLYLLIVIGILLFIDLVLLPYYVFLENHTFRKSINDQIANKRNSDLDEVLKLVQCQNNNLKKLEL